MPEQPPIQQLSDFPAICIVGIYCQFLRQADAKAAQVVICNS
jgi:hypothetical protein